MNICLIANPIKDPSGTYRAQIEDLLKIKGIDYFVAQMNPSENYYYHVDPRSFPSVPDMALVLGGDGTILQASDDLIGTNIPILGVNLGSLGYLAEVECSQMEEVLDQVLKGDYVVEKRMMIEGKPLGSKAEERNGQYVALNDIVVYRNRISALIEIELSVNGQPIATYEADGLITCTPTGSTAYNLSAGGPIIKPTAEMITVTPICSHVLGLGSLVFDDKDEILLTVGAGRKRPVDHVAVVFDGRISFSLQTGEQLLIKRSKETTPFVKVSSTSFLDTLRYKMEKK